jgi:hypothetical protein
LRFFLPRHLDFSERHPRLLFHFLVGQNCYHLPGRYPIAFPHQNSIDLSAGFRADIGFVRLDLPARCQYRGSGNGRELPPT